MDKSEVSDSPQIEVQKETELLNNALERDIVKQVLKNKLKKEIDETDEANFDKKLSLITQMQELGE
jgi:hypothetical protein